MNKIVFALRQECLLVSKLRGRRSILAAGDANPISGKPLRELAGFGLSGFKFKNIGIADDIGLNIFIQPDRPASDHWTKFIQL